MSWGKFDLDLEDINPHLYGAHGWILVRGYFVLKEKITKPGLLNCTQACQ
jgi:hypothetical protein